jgi:hypothetical protein
MEVKIDNVGGFAGRLPLLMRSWGFGAVPFSGNEKTDVWVRATVRLVNNNGVAWMVTHEHVSVSFRMDGSYNAAIDRSRDGRKVKSSA